MNDLPTPNAFTGVDQSQTNAFSGVASDTPNGPPQKMIKPPNGTSAQQTAALATIDPKAPSVIDDLRAATASYSDAAKAYGDTAIRYGIASQQRSEAVNRAIDLAGSSMASPVPNQELATQASNLAQQELSKTVEQRQAYAQEQKAVENIQTLAGHGDTIQAKLLLDNMVHGGPINIQADINTKQMIIRREIEKAQVDVKDQGWATDLADFVAGAIPRIPGVTDTNVWSFDGDNVVKSWYDGLFSGNRQANEIGSLQSLPVDQFEKVMREQIVPTIVKNSSFMGFTNHSDVLDMLTRLQQTPSPMSQNLMDGLDNLGWIPYSKIGKLASLPGYMIGLGARKEASELLAKAATDIIANGTDGAKATSGLVAREVESGLTPSAIDVQGMDADSMHSQFEDWREGQKPKTGVGEGGNPNPAPNEAEPTKTDVPEGRPVAGEAPQVPDTTVPKRPVPVAVTAIQALQSAEKLLSGVGLEGSGRLSTSEMARAEQSYIASISEMINNQWIKIGHIPETSPIQDIQFNNLKLANGSTIRQPIITMGGFATKEEALNFANSLGFTDAKIEAQEKAIGVEAPEVIRGTTPNGFPVSASPQPTIGTGFPQWSAERGEFIKTHPVIQDASGQYMVQVTRNLPEHGFYTNVLNPQAETTVARKVLNARLLGDTTLANQAALSGNMQNHFLRNVIEPYTIAINQLRSNQRWFLGQVLAKGEAESHWWTRDEFNTLYERAQRRLPTEKEWEAFTAYRKLNDIEHILRNDSEYVSRAAKGMETVSFNSGIGKVSRENAVVDRTLPIQPPTQRSFVVGRNIHFTSKNPLTDEQFKLLGDQGYFHVETERPVELDDGTTVKHFFVKPEDTNIENLRRDQTNYLEGGHREYQGKYFVKQAVTGTQKDTGQQFLDSAKTHVIMETKAQADTWVKTMEDVRQAYNEGRYGDIAGITKGHAGYPTSDKLVEGFQSGSLRADTPFVSLYDRELPEEYYKLNTDMVDYSNRDESGISSWLRTQGRMYYGSKGPVMPDYHGALAPTLDPYEVLNTSLMNVAKLSSFTDYKQAAVQRWVESFKAYTDYDKLTQGVSPWQIFERAEVSPETWKNNPRLANGIQAQKDIIKQVLGWRTPTDFAKDQYSRRLAEWVGGNDPDNTLRQWAGKQVDWWASKSPLDLMRGWAFDVHLGLFNPASFALHASTAAAVMAMGKNSFSTMLALPFMRMYLMKNAGEDFLNDAVKRGIWKDIGFASEDEFKAFMRYSKNSGFLDINSTHQLINSYGPRAALSDYGNALDKVRQAGRFFFNEGVLMTRMAAQKIAWQEVREKVPQLAVDSTEFKAAVAGRAEDYSLSMSRESSSHWQSGLLSIPTQFWAYPARILEAMFGPTFDRATRARLITSQLVLGGAAALPFTSTLMRMYEDKTGQIDIPPDSLTGIVDRGLLDTVLYKMTGADTVIGHRFTAGKDVDDIVKNIFGLSSFGVKSFAEVFGGVSGQLAEQSGETVYNLMKYAIQESGGQTERPVTSDDIKNMTLNIGTISNAQKAYLILKYGQMVSKQGEVTTSGLPTATAFEVMILGGTPGNVDHISRMMDWRSDETKAVKEAAQVISGFRQRAWSQPDKASDYTNQVNYYVQMLPPEIAQKALRESTKSLDPSLEESLNKQIQREQAQKIMIQNIQESK